jgi:hypothetical protein
MSSLAGKTLLSTYTSLLKLEGDTQALVAGGGTAIQIKTGDNEVTPIYLNTDRVGIGTAAPSALLHIDQASSSGAVPVLKLDQADIDDTFIDFIGTTAGDSTRSISTSTATGSAKFGAVMVEINGVTKWIRIYDTAV